jgi:uncharacterized membrane protein
LPSTLPPAVELSKLGPNERLLLAALIGCAASWLVWSGMPALFALAIGWIAGVAFFLAATALVLARATPDRMRARARMQDPLRPVILIVVIAAAAVSLVALGFMLQQKGAGAGPIGTGPRILLAGLAVLASWLLTHTMFALHYAHCYYGDGSRRRGVRDQDRGGLKFPDELQPDFWDFLYFSFVVGMTRQVSDVQVVSRHIRRLTLGHGVLAFFFNAVILALAVNFIANAI